MTILYNVTLDGATAFTDPSGAVRTWDGSHFETLDLHSPSTTEHMQASITLGGDNWWIDKLEISSDYSSSALISEATVATNRSIGVLELGKASSVELASTDVGWINGAFGFWHSVTLTDLEVPVITLDSPSTGVSLTGSSVDYLRTGDGFDSIFINDASTVQTLITQGDDDHVFVTNARIDYLDTGEGYDALEASGASGGTMVDSGGDNHLEFSDGSSWSHVELRGGGVNTIELNDTSEILSLAFHGPNGGVNTTTTADGKIGSIQSWGTSNHITVGAGGVNQMAFFGAIGLDQAITTAGGRVGSILVDDNMRAILTLGDPTDAALLGADVGSVQTSGGNDTIAVHGGTVEMLRSGLGNDGITYFGGSGTLLDSGAGDDTVELANVGMMASLIDTGGTDHFTFRMGTELGDIQIAGGTDVLLFEDSATAQSINLSGTPNVTLITADGHIGSIDGQDATGTFHIGAGGVGQMLFSGSAIGNIGVAAEGWVGSLRITDDLIATVELGDGGAGTLRLAGGSDAVLTGAGLVETIITGDNEDEVFLGAGGAETVRLGSGDDFLMVDGMAPDLTLVVRGGQGTDTLSFQNYASGVTFTFERVGVQNPGAPGGDLGSPGAGFIWAYGMENLTGSLNDDRLTGDDGANTLKGLVGDDVLIGGGGHDWLLGDDGADRLIGNNGKDVLEGGAGNDVLKGGRHNDDLSGGRGRDLLEGGKGDDLLAGGEGRDILIGYTGADVFFFEAAGNVDHVVDFEDGRDILRIADHTGGFGTLGIHEKGGDLRITYDGGMIILDDLGGAELTVADFDFV